MLLDAATPSPLPLAEPRSPPSAREPSSLLLPPLLPPLLPWAPPPALSQRSWRHSWKGTLITA
jgi:hypothetical protein